MSIVDDTMISFASLEMMHSGMYNLAWRNGDPIYYRAQDYDCAVALRLLALFETDLYRSTPSLKALLTSTKTIAITMA